MNTSTDSLERKTETSLPATQHLEQFATRQRETCSQPPSSNLGLKRGRTIAVGGERESGLASRTTDQPNKKEEHPIVRILDRRIILFNVVNQRALSR